MKRNPEKYSLHENEIKQLENGKILRFGKGSFYKINSYVYEELMKAASGPNKTPWEWNDIKKAAKKRKKDLVKDCIA